MTIWGTIAAAVVKELRLLTRDWHGLALLFVMPAAFILVMSLALQDAYSARAGQLTRVVVIDRDLSAGSEVLRTYLAEAAAFDIVTDTSPGADAALLLRAGKRAFAVEISAGYGASLAKAPDLQAPAPVRVTVAEDVDKRAEVIFLAALRGALDRQRVERLLKGLKALQGPKANVPDKAEGTPVAVAYAFRGGGADREAAPSAVQQNVPAWLVFAMFFVAIPLSNTFIRERELGVQARLRTTNMGAAAQFLGKLIPYFCVNVAQALLMLAIGVAVVPLLGGDRLALNGDPLALAALISAISLAALGLALLIAVIARTTEQATLTSGLGNIVLAAIGGIMAPRFIMPPGMQKAAELSPMGWGLDGFLDLLLRGEGLLYIAPLLFKLAGFGLLALLLAWAVHRSRSSA